MKKIFLIGFPLVALIAAMSVAGSEADKERDDLRRVHQEVFVLADSGFRLGVVLSELSRAQMEKWNLDSGVQVEEVLEDTPADKAGIQEGDIILKVDGTGVSEASDVRRLLRKLDEPRQLTLEILRDGKQITLTVTPEKRTIRFMRGFGRNYIGVELQELDADLAAYFKVEPNTGILVTRVERDSPAQEAGIKSGDVITHFNGKKVTDQQDLRQELDEVEEDATAEVAVLRHGAEKKLTVRPAQRTFHFPELREMPEIPAVPLMRDEMKELKEEMLRLQKELKEKLQPEIEKLKKELQEMKKST